MSDAREGLSRHETMSLKSEYRRMMNAPFYRLTIFEFSWMIITMPVWMLWYQMDRKYFDRKR